MMKIAELRAKSKEELKDIWRERKYRCRVRYAIAPPQASCCAVSSIRAYSLSLRFAHQLREKKVPRTFFSIPLPRAQVAAPDFEDRFAIASSSSGVQSTAPSSCGAILLCHA